jgi:predicted O-methyltransferase YrrM
LNLALASKYGRYLFRAKTKHGVHSPFLYNLFATVIEDEHSYYVFDRLSKIRRELSCTEKYFEVEDLGAGSRKFTGNKRRLSDIIKHGISKEKYARLLFRLVHHFQPSHVIELGTSIGLTTLYLAAPDSRIKVYTIEGSKQLLEFAKEMFHKNGFSNIETIHGNFDDQLPGLINSINQLDFLYIDGNHTKDATIRYFELALNKIHNETVIIFDDIHWSKGMEEAWEEIRSNPAVTLSVDLFQFGIVFFRKENKEKEHFVLRY